MKKYSFRIVIWMLVSFLTAASFLYAQQKRNLIHDIHAISLSVSADDEADGYINATDAVYNWFQNTFMFSVEIREEQPSDKLTGTWYIENGNNSFTVTSESVSDNDTCILTCSVPGKLLQKGTWKIYGSITNENGKTCSLSNRNNTEKGILLFTFISDVQ